MSDASVAEVGPLDFGNEMGTSETCPVCRTAEIVCGKWTLLLVRDLAEGRSRFCELERSLQGISPRTLSLRLRALEEEGILERHTYPEVPPRVEYALTEKGRALVPLIEDMRAYGLTWLAGDCVEGVAVPVNPDATVVELDANADPTAVELAADAERAPAIV